ncbi:D-alanyl carrier protein [Bacillus wiedmannii]|nr:D-alanyl carrier protein [Bacillus wiedmannii]PEO05022.1 D-alanyl carrier protein [Bacillus wiedmannii]PEP98152.1 D-alanyl carrier protein [Bacillus wiedmannii]
MMGNIRTDLKGFLLTHINSRDLRDNDDIFSLGYVNSLFAMELIMFIEKNFSISIGREDLEIDNFRTVDALVKLVERKLAY